jgi:hypothetical protein
MTELLAFAGGALCGAAAVWLALYVPLRSAYNDLDGAHRRLTDRDNKGRFTRREG